MSRSYLVSSIADDGVVFPVDEIVARARERWGDTLEHVHTSSTGHLTPDLTPVGEPGYSIRIAPRGQSLSTDGTAEQAAAVAVWARSLLPAETPSELWFYDDYGHTVLTPGMTESEVWPSYLDGFETASP